KTLAGLLVAAKSLIDCFVNHHHTQRTLRRTCLRRLHAQIDLRIVTRTITRLRGSGLHFELEILRIKNTLCVYHSSRIWSMAVSSNGHHVLEIGAVRKCNQHTSIVHLHTFGSDYTAVSRQIDEESLIGNIRSEDDVDRFTGPVDRLISLHVDFRIVGE